MVQHPEQFEVQWLTQGHVNILTAGSGIKPSGLLNDHFTFCATTHLFAEVFSDDLLDLFHAALGSLAMQHLQCGCVLFRQQVVQSTKVLANFNESTPIGTAQFSQSLCWSQMHLRMMEEMQIKKEPNPNMENWNKNKDKGKKLWLAIICIFMLWNLEWNYYTIKESAIFSHLWMIFQSFHFTLSKPFILFPPINNSATMILMKYHKITRIYNILIIF